MHRHITTGWLLGIAAVLTSLLTPVSAAWAERVRWDIISINVPVPPLTTINPDGVAFAKADPYNLEIKLTGSGTFVAPPSGAISGAVKGGGTWATFAGGQLTGSGTYRVRRLVSWEMANFQSPVPGLTDNIGDVDARANGTAVLKIDFSDGSKGTLVIGCHGPGAPAGIFEGVTVTKDFITYWNPPAPLPTVDENRTLFHLLD
jgi:hypothetical protein